MSDELEVADVVMSARPGPRERFDPDYLLGLADFDDRPPGMDYSCACFFFHLALLDLATTVHVPVGQEAEDSSQG
jgi:hypothetical protein